MNRRVFPAEPEEDVFGTTELVMDAIMELTGNDEICARPLRPAPKMFCQYPECKQFSTGLPQLYCDRVSFSRFNCYLCPDHNRCFYCKKPDADFYRLCSACMVRREHRKKLRALPPPLKSVMSDFIMRKLGLTRDVVNLVCRYLRRIDQVMWAIACGSSWRRRPHYADQARRHGTPAQTLWFLKQGCLPENRSNYFIRYLENNFSYGKAILHIRRYHFAMKKTHRRNVMATVNMLGYHFCHEKYWSTDDDSDGEQAAPVQPYEFFKWNFLQLRSKSLKAADGSSCLALLVEEEATDLLAWLKEKGCVDTFGTYDNIREADARRQSGLMRVYMAEDAYRVNKALEKVFCIRAKERNWDHVRFLLECGVKVPQGLISYADWLQIEQMVKSDQYDQSRWPLIELIAEYHGSLPESDYCHLIKEAMLELVHKLVQLKFSFPPKALSLAVKLGVTPMAELLLEAGLVFTPHDLLTALKAGNLELLKLAARYGSKFGQSDMILAEVLQHQHIVWWLDAQLAAHLFSPSQPN